MRNQGGSAPFFVSSNSVIVITSPDVCLMTMTSFQA